MATNRKPGSDHGRTTVDWEAAFVYWASLPAPGRSYRAVADEFGVSVRTVETHGRDGRWHDRLQTVEQDARGRANEELADGLIESLSNAQRLADATLVRFGQQLAAGQVKVTPSDLTRMVALQQQLADTVADLTQAASRQTREAEPVGEPDQTAVAAHQLEVLRALNDAGALDPILALLNTPTHTT